MRLNNRGRKNGASIFSVGLVEEANMTAISLAPRWMLPALLAIGPAGCRGGHQSGSTVASASETSGQATILATASATRTIVKFWPYQIDPAKVFVAGISSGGFAAVQMHVAHCATRAVASGGIARQHIDHWHHYLPDCPHDNSSVSRPLSLLLSASGSSTGNACFPW